jgi:hypothetical protein
VARGWIPIVFAAGSLHLFESIAEAVRLVSTFNLSLEVRWQVPCQKAPPLFLLVEFEFFKYILIFLAFVLGFCLKVPWTVR